jgi:hypothetical protein
MITDSTSEVHARRCAGRARHQDEIIAELRDVRTRMAIRRSSPDGSCLRYLDIETAIVLVSVDICWEGWLAVVGHPDEGAYEWVAKFRAAVPGGHETCYRASNASWGGIASCLRDGLNTMEEWL